MLSIQHFKEKSNICLACTNKLKCSVCAQSLPRSPYPASQLQRNARYTLKQLCQVPGLRVIEPQGAMYVMVGIDVERFSGGISNDLEFCELLLQEEAVFVLPGKCFGMPNFFRVVFTAPMAKLQQAYSRIAAFCARHVSLAK